MSSGKRYFLTCFYGFSHCILYILFFAIEKKRKFCYYSIEVIRMVEIKVKDYGVIKAELYPESAPETVENFLSLVRDGFYDGLIFHRVINGFMIQGGDPDGNGTGGSGKNITGEFAANGIDNPIKHEKGVLSMARSMNYNSASSQFFICQADCPWLDGQYAAFGKVTDGISVVDDIASVSTDFSDRPQIDVVIEYIKEL